MKTFTQSVYIFYRNRERKCAAAFEYFVEDCVVASRNISMFFHERAKKNFFFEKIFVFFTKYTLFAEKKVFILKKKFYNEKFFY